MSLYFFENVDPGFKPSSVIIPLHLCPSLTHSNMLCARLVLYQTGNFLAVTISCWARCCPDLQGTRNLSGRAGLMAMTSCCFWFRRSVFMVDLC
jgi:uncharacterized membrane protein YwaF